MEILEIKNLSKSYGNKVVLDDINLKVEKGKIIGLLGKNGAGKTTLIKLINDLLTKTSGEILVKGNNIGVETKKIISYLPERTCINKQMKVSEVINYYKDFYSDFDEEKALEVMKEETVIVYVDMHTGDASATAWGCDLTYDYVKINADYRS